MKRILGVDFGTKRVGLAVSDPLGITAQGLETFVRYGKESLISHIEKLVNSYGVEVVVIGLPLSMSGNKIEGSGRVMELAAEIETKLEVKVVLKDERMTSLEAERLIKSQGKIKKPEDIDRLSAVLILQSYLDEKK